MRTELEKRKRRSYAKLERFLPIASRLIRSAKLNRSLAASARRHGDWVADAFYRREACRVQPERGENWVQFGHALKALGFFSFAENAYSKGLMLLPNSPNIYLELAHLAKIRGSFEIAEGYFNAASLIDGNDSEEIKREILLLNAIENSLVYPTMYQGTEQASLHIYLSAPVPAVAENSGDQLAKAIGKSDYSYGFAMRGFVRALEKLQYNFTVLSNPEFISDIRDRSDAKINVHIGFYPPERIRLLKGAYNINCFAWEFDRLRATGEVLNYHAFSDQATMLNMADEVWVPSNHGAAAVAKSVTKPVYAVPAPVLGDLRSSAREKLFEAGRIQHLAQKIRHVSWEPLAVFARLQQSMNNESDKRVSSLPTILKNIGGYKNPTIFLTILNVHDFRKQLYPMLQGFLEFREIYPESLLLVKMTTPDRGKMPINSFLLMDQVLNAGELPRPLVSDHVWITDNTLSRDEMNDLYDIGAFYVCTSHAEGQNLPILEAMGRGMVPISVDNTAMADYITPETSVIIPSYPRPLGPRLASRYGIYELETNFVEAADVRRAFERAASLSQEEYSAQSAASLEMVVQNYGVKNFAAALERSIDAAQSSMNEVSGA